MGRLSEPIATDLRENEINDPAEAVAPKDRQLDHACQRWLDARKRFYNGARKNAWAAYMEADYTLLVAFARDWPALDDRSLALSFHSLRQALAMGFAEVVVNQPHSVTATERAS